MTYPPQQPGNWPDQSWPTSPYGDPAGNASSGGPAYAGPEYGYGYPTSGAYPASGAPASPAGYNAYGYGYAQPVPVTRQTNGMSIAAMVISIVGAVALVCYGFGGLLGIVGAILGHVSRKQIRERGEGGGGMAMAGIVVGWISTALAVIIGGLIVALFVWAVNQPTPTDPYPYPS
jgi:MFS family permease